MAEAPRTEEEEENMMRGSREQVVRRQPNSSGGRRKPEHRLSQGPLSSIRAAIKRTSTRSTSLSESTNRERERDRERDRRRPEITILSAEPLASTSWFPGATAGLPPPPPPPAQIWGPTIPPSIQPPPSYEEVIREKSQEQVLCPSPSSSSSSASSSLTRQTATASSATQTDPGTDPGSAPETHYTHVRRPVRPPRPRLSNPPKPSPVDDIITVTSQSRASADGDIVVPDRLQSDLTENSLVTSTSGSQTDQWEQSIPAVKVETPPTTSSSVVPLERPRPRPRSRLSVPCTQPISNEVKVQTLVKLRDDGVATLAARTAVTDDNKNTKQEVNQGTYLQELLQAFSADDWGFPDRRSDSSGSSQSESEEGEDQEVDQEEEDMATLKARIQAFEQQQQQLADDNNTDFAVAKRPEPRPRPRLQWQQAKSGPPTVAPKPKNFAHAPKPSTKVFWEDGSVEPSKTTETETPSTAESQLPTTTETHSPTLKSSTIPSKNTEKPTITPKPVCVIDPLPAPAPVPAPRPVQSKPPGENTHPQPNPSTANPKLPPRPPVAPRANVAAPPQDRSTVAGHTTPPMPPRPSGAVVVVGTIGSEEKQDTINQTVKVGSVRPGVPNKPAALNSLRRASAPSLAPKPTSTPPDLHPVPSKPTAVPPTTAPKPAGPSTVPTPAVKPPTPTQTPAPTFTQTPTPTPHPAPAPAPALRKTPAIHTKPTSSEPTLPPRPSNPNSSEPTLPPRPSNPNSSEPTLPPRPSNPNSSEPTLPPRPSSVKLLPLRPPPIKSIPGRPPPPTNQTAPSKVSPAPSVSPANQPSPSQTGPASSPVSANETQPPQRGTKRGPPLPPRPKPGHPLYNTYMKQEVLIVLDEPSQSDQPSGDEGRSQSAVTPSQCLLDLDQPETGPEQDSQSKHGLEDLDLTDSQSILPVEPTEHKEQPDPPPVSGPRCVALFDYEGEEEDELTFSQGDVISLLQLIGQDWGRGQIHGRIGIFPLNFAEVVEPPLPSSPGETSKQTTTEPDTTETESNEPKTSQDPESEVKEWALAVFAFPGQTAEDLSFHKGALIHVTEHIDAEWRRGRLDGREGVYPAAFTQACHAQPIPGQHSEVKGVAKFDFTAESEDELTLKVGDIIEQVESVDEQWSLGVVGGKRGIVPKNYISLF